YEISPGFTPFAIAGAFPIFNTDLNAGSTLDPENAVGRFPSHDKWMFGAQLGSNVRVVPEVEFTFGAAYYDFTNVQGQLSSFCFAEQLSRACDTDLTRPSFAQRGNTYMALRNIVPFNIANIGTESQFQYFGLASAFRDVVLSGRLDLGHFDPVHIILDG